jgi:hypothetical protein
MIRKNITTCNDFEIIDIQMRTSEIKLNSHEVNNAKLESSFESKIILPNEEKFSKNKLRLNFYEPMKKNEMNSLRRTTKSDERLSQFLVSTTESSGEDISPNVSDISFISDVNLSLNESFSNLTTEEESSKFFRKEKKNKFEESSLDSSDESGLVVLKRKKLIREQKRQKAKKVSKKERTKTEEDVLKTIDERPEDMVLKTIEEKQIKTKEEQSDVKIIDDSKEKISEKIDESINNKTVFSEENSFQQSASSIDTSSDMKPKKFSKKHRPNPWEKKIKPKVVKKSIEEIKNEIEEKVEEQEKPIIESDSSDDPEINPIEFTRKEKDISLDDWLKIKKIQISAFKLTNCAIENITDNSYSLLRKRDFLFF